MARNAFSGANYVRQETQFSLWIAISCAAQRSETKFCVPFGQMPLKCF
jgi:hypothetical protein